MDYLVMAVNKLNTFIALDELALMKIKYGNWVKS